MCRDLSGSHAASIANGLGITELDGQDQAEDFREDESDKLIREL